MTECLNESGVPQHIRSIWIEAESWPPDEWDTHDANSSVVVEFTSGQRWHASLVTFKNVTTLINKNMTTGECLNGTYLWAANMILIEELRRVEIERIVMELIASGEFELAFNH